MGVTVITNGKVEQAGIYVCGTCGNNQLTLEKGDEAPRCDNCHWPVSWQLIRRLVDERRIGF